MPFETHCEAALPLAVLSPEARERLGRISTVKPDKARQVENLLLQAVSRGQLRPALALFWWRFGGDHVCGASMDGARRHPK